MENGTIIYRDASSGSVERLERLDAKFSAESLHGPFDSIGRLDFRGIPLSYETSVGRVINEQTVPLSLAIAAEPGDARLEVSGAVVELADAPKFRGKMVAAGKMLSDLMAAVGSGAAPSIFAQPFEAAGDVTVSTHDLSVKNLSVSLGMLRGDGELTANLAENPISFNTKLMLPKVDLDALLAPPQPKPESAPAEGPEATSDAVLTAPAKPQPVPKPVQAAFRLPQGANGTIELAAGPSPIAATSSARRGRLPTCTAARLPSASSPRSCPADPTCS